MESEAPSSESSSMRCFGSSFFAFSEFVDELSSSCAFAEEAEAFFIIVVFFVVCSFNCMSSLLFGATSSWESEETSTFLRIMSLLAAAFCAASFSGFLPDR